jgi:hypothetical protein
MKICSICKNEFEWTKEDKDLLEKLTPVIAGEKIPLPELEICFNCRLKKKLAFYNRRQLYKRNCDLTGEPIISVMSPDKNYKVYNIHDWFGDSWDPLEYGRDFDFNRPFFEQFNELLKAVPHIGLALLGDNVNSDYTNDNYKLKNCYLIFDGEQAEDSYYGESFVGLKNCIDFTFLYKSELCYECMYCTGCYNLKYSRFCDNCSDSWFLRDCFGCKHCVGCANLHQKEYYIFNKPYSKEEYEERMKAFNSGDYRVIEDIKKQADEFFLTQPVKAMRGLQNQDVSGDNLSHCKSAHYCFDCLNQRDCRHCVDCMMNAADCFDIYAWGDGLEHCYNCLLAGAGAQNVYMSCYAGIGASDLFYSFWCTRNCKNLFGCFGLKQKEYCILNKQYEKSEYEKTALQIAKHMQKTGEWGQFFAPEISEFGYNETLAQDNYHMTKEEALKEGYKWCDYESKVEAKKVLAGEDIPFDIAEIEDDILDNAIKCIVTGKLFKIAKPELDFYRKHNLPIPRKHPDQRHWDRLKLRNSYNLWKKKCANCGTKIQTSYAPGGPEIIHCEECYLKAIV